MERTKIHIQLLLILLLLAHYDKLYPQSASNVQYEFTELDLTFTFKGSFITNADVTCLLDVCFTFEHNLNLSYSADNIELVDQGESWNRIRYTYCEYYFFENISVWERKLDVDNQRVDFSLLTSVNSSTLMPKMLSSTGYYRITNQSNATIMEYFQEFTLSESILTNIYKEQLKIEAIRFINFFSEYAKSSCEKK
jgi:hypothetical protein